MAKQVKTSLDLNKNPLLQLVIEKLATAPSSPVASQMYCNTSGNIIYYFNGTEWIAWRKVPNTSNLGTGVNVFKGPNGDTLEFYTVKSTSNLLTVAISSNELQFTINQANIAHQSISGAGSNTHAQIDSHVASSANPHSVTKAQVGLSNVDNVQQMPLSYLDTDVNLAANSDAKVASQKAVRTFVEGKLAGLVWKDKVRLATTGPGTLSTSFANGQSIDGVALVTGDRILIKNQANGAENGIYKVNASGAPTRDSDANTGAMLINASVFVSEGAINADTAWTCNNNAITIGTTAIAFVQFGGAGTYQAGSGMELLGNTFNVKGIDTTHFGSNTIDTDTTLAANSDTRLPTQKAIKTYVDTKASQRASYYKGTIANASSGTIAIATHVCGTSPLIQVFETSGGNSYVVEVDIVINAAGDVSWAATEAFTGFIVIIGK
jgi:hypothetical protein